MRHLDAHPADVGRERYVDAITAGRRAKDVHVRTSPDSPLRRAGDSPQALRYFAIDPRHSCPPTPAENRLAVPILAGERLHDGGRAAGHA